VTENFEEVARALNEGNALPWDSNGKYCNDRYKLLLANFRKADQACALARGTDEEFGERYQQLADIQSPANEYEERCRTELKEYVERGERSADTVRSSGEGLKGKKHKACLLPTWRGRPGSFI
jgi:hypothetical protein